MIDFVGRRRFYAVISLLMIVPSLIGLALWQFEAGLDFAGGLESEVRFVAETSIEDVQAALDEAELAEGVSPDLSHGEDGSFIINVEHESPTAESIAEAQQTISAALSAELPGRRTVVSGADESGSSEEFWFPGAATQDQVRQALETVDLGGARIQQTTDDAFRIRVEQPADGDLERLRQRINEALRSEIGPIVVRQSSSVSGTLSVEIARDAGVALAVAAVAILIYISLAFRRLPNPVLYGSAAIVALLHDVTIVAGAFAIGGQVAGLEVNAMFVDRVAGDHRLQRQ